MRGNSQFSADKIISKKFPFLYSDVAATGDLKSNIHCTLHYFFDAVMPILQAFYTKFYIPEKDMYPAEVENTDKLARAFVVGFYTYLL